jgi:hypothetical protein
MPGNERALLLPVRLAKVDLDDVGENNERRPAGGIDEIVERDQESPLLQANAGVDDFLVGLHGFQNFHHRGTRREE